MSDKKYSMLAAIYKTGDGYTIQSVWRDGNNTIYLNGVRTNRLIKWYLRHFILKYWRV